MEYKLGFRGTTEALKRAPGKLGKVCWSRSTTGHFLRKAWISMHKRPTIRLRIVPVTMRSIMALADLGLCPFHFIQCFSSRSSQDTSSAQDQNCIQRFLWLHFCYTDCAHRLGCQYLGKLLLGHCILSVKCIAKRKKPIRNDSYDGRNP